MEERAPADFSIEGDHSVDYKGHSVNRPRTGGWRSTPSNFALDNSNWRIILYTPLCAVMAILLTYTLVNFMQVNINPYQTYRNQDPQMQSEIKPGPRRPAFDVCLMVTMGDDGQAPPGNSTLPFTVLHRLFEMVKKLVQEEEYNQQVSGKVFVGVDYPSIVCKMVRDATLAVDTVCLSFDEMQNKTQVGCLHMVVGKTTRFVKQLSEVGMSSPTWGHLHFVDLESSSFQMPSLAAIKPTIVTGFSQNHLIVGLLLLRSIGKVVADAREINESFDISVVVWAMDKFTGNGEKEFLCAITELKEQWKVSIEVREFDFMALPTWMQINESLGHFGGTGEYAWKVIMIHTVFLERGLVLWVDAGSRFTTVKALTGVLESITEHGFASKASQGPIGKYTFPAQIQYLRASTVVDVNKRDCCDGSTVGFSLKRYEELLLPWYECAITRQCIAPDGSDRANHRQDQAALTVLAALTKNECEGITLDIARHMDNDLDNLVGVNKTTCYDEPRPALWK